MKKLLLTTLLFLILFISTNSYIFSADSASNPVRNFQFLNGTNRELIFGPVISGLKGTGILTSKSIEGNVRSSGGERTERLHFSIDTDKTTLHSRGRYDYVRIEDLKPYGNPGEPQLPFKSYIVTLPINSEVSGVSVSDVSYQPILNKLDIVPVPIPVTHAQNEKQTNNGNKKYNKCKTCDSESFFPGNLVSYYTGKDNNERYVFIKFFPVQYIPKTKRALLITNADITVNYQLTYTERSGE